MATDDLWRTTWNRVDVRDLPEILTWQKQAEEKLRDNFEALASIFMDYCKRGAGPASTGIASSFTMSSREFVLLVKECKIPLSVSEANDTFRRVDRAEHSKSDKKSASNTRPDKQLVLSECQLSPPSSESLLMYGL